MRHLELWVNYYIRWNPRIKQQVNELALLKTVMLIDYYFWTLIRLFGIFLILWGGMYETKKSHLLLNTTFIKIVINYWTIYFD